jgi:hypothetical protein
MQFLKRLITKCKPSSCPSKVYQLGARLPFQGSQSDQIQGNVIHHSGVPLRRSNLPPIRGPPSFSEVNIHRKLAQVSQGSSSRKELTKRTITTSAHFCELVKPLVEKQLVSDDSQMSKEVVILFS